VLQGIRSVSYCSHGVVHPAARRPANSVMGLDAVTVSTRQGVNSNNDLQDGFILSWFLREIMLE